MKKLLALFTITALVGLLAACGGNAKSDGKALVVASFYPYAYIAEQVGAPSSPCRTSLLPEPSHTISSSSPSRSLRFRTLSW